MIQLNYLSWNSFLANRVVGFESLILSREFDVLENVSEFPTV